MIFDINIKKEYNIFNYILIVGRGRRSVMLKKIAFKAIFGILLSGLIIIFAYSVSAAESYSTGTYLVTEENGVHLYEKSEISVDFNTTAGKGAYINVIKVSGNFGYTVYDSIYGWVDLTSGVEFIDKMPSITDEGKIEGTKGIEITEKPDKLTYIEGEESADITGLKVSLIFDDKQGSKMEVTGYTVSFPDLDTYGAKKVTVYYGGYSASFDITVNKVPVTGIVITMPLKTSYVEGEAISFDGLTVKAYYSDGRDKGQGIVLEKGEYAVSGAAEGDTGLSPGTYKVTVTYKYPEISAEFHIYVSEKFVTELKLIKMPQNVNLYQGQTFNKSDFVLSATYDNGITEEITDFDIEYDNMQIGKHTARIYYYDRYVAFDYIVYELFESYIELGDTTAVGSYLNNDIDFSKLKVYVVYNSGERKEITDYTLKHNIDIAKAGEYPVTVVYKDFTKIFYYTVAQKYTVIAGDVNLDGKITSADARLALRNAAGLETLSEEAFLAADVNSDKKVTASDARKILRVSAGLDRF